MQYITPIAGAIGEFFMYNDKDASLLTKIIQADTFLLLR